MDSRMNLLMAQEHMADLERVALASRRRALLEDETEVTPVIALRLAAADEAGELATLAALDSARPLRGEVLVAIVDGELVAAISLDDGRVVANPLTRTGEAQALLGTRAAQLGRKPRPRRRLRFRLRPRFA
jgi:hypothetical protein